MVGSFMDAPLASLRFRRFGVVSIEGTDSSLALRMTQAAAWLGLYHFEQREESAPMLYASSSSAPPATVPSVAKSAMRVGAAVSKPTTSSMPASFGSAMVKLLATMPATTSFASGFSARRYSPSAREATKLHAEV